MGRKMNKKGCEHRERSKKKPEENTSKQVRECHGDIPSQDHPCVFKNKKEVDIVLICRLLYKITTLTKSQIFYFLL